MAELRLAKMSTQAYEQGHFELKRPSALTFGEFSERCKKVWELRCRSYKRYHLVYLNRLTEYFGEGFLVRRIDPAKALSLQQWLRSKMDAASTNRAFSIFKSMWTIGKKLGLVDTNPTEGIALLPESKGRIRYLERPELLRLVNAAPDWLHPLIVIAAQSGLRLSELLRLQWRDVDFSNSVVHVVKTKTDTPRVVDMTDDVRQLLLSRCEGAKPDHFVVHEPGGEPVGHRKVEQGFKKLVEDLKLDQVSWHTLRHTYISYLAMAGADVKTIMQLAGHRQITTTMRYTHLSPEHRRLAVGKLGLYLIGDRQGTFKAHEPSEETEVHQKAGTA